MASNEPMRDYYAILGVPRFSDSPQELRRAYKEQVLFFHPDKGNVNENIALERTQLLNEAYKTLKDPEKKAEYDRALKAQLQRESYAAKKQEDAVRQESQPKDGTGRQQARPEAETVRQQTRPNPEAGQHQTRRPYAQAEPDAHARQNDAEAGADERLQRMTDLADRVLAAVRKKAEKAIGVLPTLPKPVIAGILIISLLVILTFMDMIYWAALRITAPSEIDHSILASGEVERELHTAYIAFERYRSRIHDTCEFFESPDAGYASGQFYASQKVIVMRRGDGPRYLTLTVDYSGATSISIQADTDAASIHFPKEVWYDRDTLLMVTANHAGITEVTFANSRSKLSFRVKIIVL